jgi:hypothetical protein
LDPANLSLGQFTAAVFREQGLAEVPTPVQLQLLDYLENGPKRRILAAFRGVGKSTLSAIYVAWRMARNYDEKVLILSASASRAEAMAVWIARLFIDTPWLNHLAPDTQSGRYSKIAFDVGCCRYIEQSHSVRASGVTGQITGSRASIILADDIETPQSSLTQTQREKLRSVITELNAILKPGEESEILLLGTPHSATESIYFHLHRMLSFSMRIWPARVPQTEEPYNACLAPLVRGRMTTDVGRPTDTRFTDEELRTRELSMSPLAWRLQYMVDATMSDQEKYPLKCGDLMVTTIDQTLPEIVTHSRVRANKLVDLPCCGLAHDSTYYSPHTMEGSIDVDDVPTVMAIDPSAGGADEFAWAILKAWGGNYFLMNVGGRRGGVNETFWRHLAKLAKTHHVNQVLVESNFGGLEVWAQTFKPYLREIKAECSFEGIRSNMRKEVRIIDTLAPVLQTHRMVIDRRVIEADYKVVQSATTDRELSYSVFYQMSRLTQERGALFHDDRLDCWAMAVAWFQEQSALDQKIQHEDRRMEILLASFEDEMGNVLMTPDRLALGLTIEQARKADAGAAGASFVSRMRPGRRG